MEKRFKKSFNKLVSKFVKLGVVAFLILNCLPLQTNAESTNGIVEESEYNPTYTIQHYLNYRAIDLENQEPNGIISDTEAENLYTTQVVPEAKNRDTTMVWRTDGSRDNKLPYNFNQQNNYFDKYDKKTLYEQSPHNQITFNDGGETNKESLNIGEKAEIGTKKELRKLFADEETTFFEKSQMRFMNKLYNNASDENHYNKNYTLEQVWLLKKGKDKDSTNKDDFYVLESPVMEDGHHDPSKFTFTNYKDNPAFDDSTKVTNDNGVKYIGNKTDGYTILITEDTVIRLVFEPTTEENYNYDSVNFFDYDITDGWIYTTQDAANEATKGNTVDDVSDQVNELIEKGTVSSGLPSGKLPTSYQSKPELKNVTFYANTAKQGINNPKNITFGVDYVEGEEQNFAFGNDNTKTGLGQNTWTSKTGINGSEVTAFLNMANDGNRAAIKSKWSEKEFYGPSLRGATYRLAQGVNENGSIHWSEGVNAPAIFSTNPNTLNSDGINDLTKIQGKTAYLQYSAYDAQPTNENYSLKFSRMGGTYTLSGVQKNIYENGKKIKTETASENLDKFIKNKSEIISNEFWPMDSASSHGTDGHDLKFGSADSVSYRKYVGYNSQTGDFPTSDDQDNDHNPYFGMTTYFDFVLQPGYCGP